MTKLAKTSVMAVALFGGLNFAALPPAIADDTNEYERQFYRDDYKHEQEKKDWDKNDKHHKIHSKTEKVVIKDVRDPCNKSKISVYGESTVTIHSYKNDKVLVTYKFETDGKNKYKYDVDLRGQKKFDKADWGGYKVPIYGSFEKDYGRDATEFDAKGYVHVFVKKNGKPVEPSGEHIYIKKVRCDDDRKYDHEGDKDGHHGHGKGGHDY